MKKNIQKIPKDIYAKLETIDNNEIVVGCAIKFKANELISGKLAHLGIELNSDGLQIPTEIIPSENQGKYSDRNVNGFEIIRKDLPKETHYNSIESPNWGDSYNGTHTVNLPYKKYPRDFQPPRELEILTTCNDTQPGLTDYVIAFQIKEVLDKTNNDFEDRLFENLNILQENTGSLGVESSNIPMVDYIQSLNVSWEILPPGTLEDTIERLFQGKTPTIQQKDVTTERYKFFLSLNLKKLVYGSSGFRRYFGALLEDNLVVFENIEYGNAIYILFDDWEQLSLLSRLDLMSGRFGTSFERIIHTDGWEEKVKNVVEERQKES
ncbi:hypothetical protein KKC45_00700 [Patescibacteria group bacterium]|nr:hypothetical protein [Patescibacteria group bacterium]